MVEQVGRQMGRAMAEQRDHDFMHWEPVLGCERCERAAAEEVAVEAAVAKARRYEARWLYWKRLWNALRGRSYHCECDYS
jgi:hypothetical protein